MWPEKTEEVAMLVAMTTKKDQSIRKVLIKL